MVKDALYGEGPPSEIVATYESSETGFIESVLRESICRLKPCTWLNDEIIHFFMHCWQSGTLILRSCRLLISESVVIFLNPSSLRDCSINIVPTNTHILMSRIGLNTFLEKISLGWTNYLFLSTRPDSIGVVL